MKMSLKLSIIFSVLAICVVMVFSFITYNSNLERLYQTTHTSLNTMGRMMQTEIEDYITLMDYALEELTTNVEFMDAFYQINKYGDIPVSYKQDGSQDHSIDTAQTTMSRIMYQSPLMASFYRVSAYSENGFFLTSRFEKTDIIVSFSDDAREIYASLDYLNPLEENHFLHLIVGPHEDPWSLSRNAMVFSVVKAVTWHGNFVGYLEVSADVSELANIFLVMEQEGLSTQAVFDDGSILFLFPGEQQIFPETETGEMADYQDDNLHCLVVKQHSQTLGLNIYVIQELSALQSSRSAILKQSVITLLPVLAVMILVIIFLSYSLTGSIRRLSRKIRELPAENFLSRADLSEPTTVVNPMDQEIYELEESFNDMLTKLRISHANEMTLREGALKAQLNSLQLQINPHFVYNTLNIISAKGLESGSEEVTELCDQFAQMLRYSTDVRSQTATLREELEQVRRYLYLCKSRYEDHLEYVIDVPEDQMSFQMPKLILQPLVENALKYTREAVPVCRISITARMISNESYLEIRDNGNGFNPETLNSLRRNFTLIEKGQSPDESPGEPHLGLINTYRRLFYYSRGRIRIVLSNDNGAVVRLVMNMPEDSPS